MRVEDVTFPSADGHCVGVLYRPANTGRELPVVVMAHGLSGTRLTQYDRRARRLVESGAAVLDFDNRFVGTSPGEPRQRIDPLMWLEDLRAAVSFVRALPGIDAEAVGLYGSSLGGALALAAAADDPKIRAIALDVPAIDGLRLTPAPIANRGALVAAVVRDVVARARGKAPVTLPVFGAIGSGAVVQNDTDGFWMAMNELEGITWTEPRVHARHPETGEWRNQATAIDLLNIPRFRPARRAKDVGCAVLAHLSEDDKVVPYRSTRKALESAPQADIRTLRGGHFAPFYGDGFEKTVSAQVAFFSSSLT
jgi:dienelactone hydrolase